MLPDTHAVHVTASIVVSLLGLCLLLAVTIFLIGIIKAYVVPVTAFNPGKRSLLEPHDPAWPNYFAGRVQAEDFSRLRDLQMGMIRWAFKGGWWGKFPLLLVTWPIMIIASLFLLVLNLVLAVALIIVVLIAGPAFTLLRLGMSAFENIAAKTRGAEASCPACYEVMDRPAYVCPGCGALQRDIRPSVRGAVWRVCTCGSRLPTGVRRASWQLKAVCQACSEEVHRGAAVLRDVRVPVFGEPHAGKTRLIFAGIDDLMTKAQAQGAEVRFSDDSSKERAEIGLDLIRRDQRTLKTEGRVVESALTCEIRAAKKGALLHAFDAAGERFHGADGHEDMRYLHSGHTLVFVADPFAIPGIRQLLASQPRTNLLQEHLADDARNPEESYGEVVSRIRNFGGNTKKQRLAVVVTKADLLTQFSIPVPTTSADIKQWLYDNGMHNMVLSVEREFKEVRFFAVASVATATDPRYGASEPFAWALTTRGASGLVTPAAAGATA
jgi:hypothetical protein